MDKQKKVKTDEKAMKDENVDAKEPVLTELESAIKTAVEMRELSQKIQAEFENYRKRTEKNQRDFVKFASSSIVSKLLPVIDNLELALVNKGNAVEFVKGVELIYEDLMKILGDEGLKRIEALDKEFDPKLHEALLQEESNKDNIVLQELQSGYFFNDKVLRHTKIKIGKVNKK